MPKFLTHDALSADLFNAAHSTGTGSFQPWKDVLTNTETLLLKLVKRMETDWLALPPRSRKAWNCKDVDFWHASNSELNLWYT